MAEDPRRDAARYRLDRVARERGDPEAEPVNPVVEPVDPVAEPVETPAPRPPGPTAAQVGSIADTAIQQAMRRGDFDDLPGAGKPLTGLRDTHDPDWWIKQKIQREQLTGLGPPALTLRVENTQLDDRLDAMSGEQDVRSALEDFNRRVIEARRQLLGGPPVVTPTRDVDAEVNAWRRRRSGGE